MSRASFPEAYIGCNATITDKKLCTLETCCLAQSSFLYIPDYAGNLFYTIFFAVFVLPQLVLGFKYKTWTYMIAVILGLGVEVAGYVGRLELNDNPFNNDAFLVYLIMLTIAPVFLTAAIYVCLSRIIILYGEHLSPIKARTVAISFMCSDFIALVLQAAGGAIAETADDGSDEQQTGTDIMIAGLLLQAISLCVFAAAWAFFQLRVLKGPTDQRPDRVATRSRTLFKAFQCGLLLSTVLIIIRSIYRVIELWGGFSGELWNDEVDFMVLDGAMISLSVVIMTALHPGPAFREQWVESSWSNKKKPDENEIELSQRAGTSVASGKSFEDEDDESRRE
ncbi:hypothetical protein CKM354_001074700 [Cercospora kikuchii]|uniref:Uncharacterized protein n=1 Tax=Cercospora kikuchii TaxID=84275 RepID=A0A9P3CU62_9PEZI|nr:uncharacterized protein CKM354_001074700 [Cercospora kikuchii]GIZ47662.1 hypothetical protein CKM354_001074700 [Cercospora kikuchii]